MRKTFTGLLLCLASAAHAGIVTSPSGKLTLTINADNTKCGTISMTLGSKKSTLMEGIQLGLSTSRRQYGQLRLVSEGAVSSQHTEYNMLQGKRMHCVSESRDTRYTFVNATGDTLYIDFRLSDDGLAFRYVVPGGTEGETVSGEHTTYPIKDGTRRWIQAYDISYEQFFPLATDGSDLRDGQNGRWAYPALIEPADGQFVLITESDILRQHCGSWVDNSDDRSRYHLVYASPDQPCHGQWTSPWRLLIAGSLDTVVGSTLVTDVASPAVTDRTDWIKPAPVSWIYWAYNHGSRELKLIKEYIDLAADMHWPYMLIDAEWDEMTNGDRVETALEYAGDRGVKPMLWYNSCTGWIDGAPGPKWRLNKPEDRRKEFAWLRDHGVAGIKVDFFGGDGIRDMDYYHDILEDALDYNLLVVLHGAVLPRGWQRTYPNLMTMEGVYGAEWYNNNGTLTNRAAAHNATLPFTRNVVGPMDYTPGTFSDSQHPHITSHGHELALYYLFESALQHMPDRPSSYLSLPKQVQELLRRLPTRWDETMLLNGYPAHHAVIARRSGDTWYVAGINGTDNPTTLMADLSALTKSKTEVTLYADGAQQTEFSISPASIKKGGTKLKVPCLPRGGFVAEVKVTGK